MSLSSVVKSLVLVMLLWGTAVPVAIGDPPASQPKPSLGNVNSARKARAQLLPPFTPERETAALRFVEEHHPELGQVLKRLKTANAEEYRQAVRELSATVERLALVMQHDVELHELMLEAWKVQSRAELLAAQLACAKDPDPQREQEIKNLLSRRVDLERRQVEHRRDHLREMLKATEENLQRMQENRERMVETRFQYLTRSARKTNTRGDAAQKSKTDHADPPPSDAK